MKRAIGAAFSIGVLALGAQLMTAAIAAPLPSTMPWSADAMSVVKKGCLPNNIRCRAPLRAVCVKEHPPGCCHAWGCRRPHHKDYSAI
jgi:hypothetical protein